MSTDSGRTCPDWRRSGSTYAPLTFISSSLLIDFRVKFTRLVSASWVEVIVAISISSVLPVRLSSSANC